MSINVERDPGLPVDHRSGSALIDHVRRAASRNWPSLLAALILLVVVTVACLFVWPGRMNNDTYYEIGEAMSGHVTDFGAPILLGLWHVVWGLRVGPGWILVAQFLFFVTGSYLILRTVYKPLAAAVCTGVVTLLPQVYGILTLVGRDAWYTSLLMFSVGCLAFGYAAPPQPRSQRVRRVCMLASIVTAFLALCARQNAITGVVVVAGLWIALASMSRWQRPARSLKARTGRLVCLMAGSVAIVVGMYGIERALYVPFGVTSAHFEQFLYDYDLAGMSTREHRDLFPKSVVPPSRLAGVERFFDIDDVATEFELPGAPLPSAWLSVVQIEAERRAEINAIEESPGTWLALHWEEFLRQISITRKANVIMQAPISHNSLGLHQSFPSLDNAASSYVFAFSGEGGEVPQGSVIQDVWIYLLVALVGAVVMLRRWREPRMLVLGGLALSALAYQIGVFFSLGVEYRLELPAVAIGLVTLFAGARLLLVERLRSRQRRRATPQPEAG